MSEIERLAAIISPDAFNPDAFWAPGIRGIRQHDSVQKVRAILQAMREPSEGMIDAGWPCVRGDALLGHEDQESDAKDCWQAMIDHILAEPSDG